MSIEVVCEQTMTSTGDMVGSLFKNTAGLLQESDYQLSLEYVASKKKMTAYRDMIDFLFCELVVGFRYHCKRYYDDEGPPLMAHPSATPEQIASWDIFLASALHVAHEAMEQKRRMTWSLFRTMVLQAMQKAS